jgi:hypothetical protein
MGRDAKPAAIDSLKAMAAPAAIAFIKLRFSRLRRFADEGHKLIGFGCNDDLRTPV